LINEFSLTKMQNSLTFGEVAKETWRLHVPRKIPEDVKAPNIRSTNNREFTQKDMEYTQTERSELYTPFIVKPLRKCNKRATCIKAKGHQTKYEHGCWQAKE
jgi:hypothetical protein